VPDLEEGTKAVADNSLVAGVARVVITPPVGIPMWGFAGRGVSTDVHDDLTATALVLRSSAGGSATSQLALVCCDLLSLDATVIDRIRIAVRERIEVNDVEVLVASSHTHYGPITSRDGLTVSGESGPLTGPYVDNLVHTIVGAIVTAAGRLVPSRLLFGRGAVSVGINRRERRNGTVVLGQNPDGPVDPTVRVLRVDTADGQPLAAILNYACHPVSLGGSCTQMTADFPGVARRVVEEGTGAMCLFLQGAAGDVNPLVMGWEWNHLPRLGLPLGAEGVRAFWGAETVEDASALTIRRRMLELPPILPDSEQGAVTQIGELEDRQKLVSAEKPGSSEAYWIQARLTKLRSGLAVLREQAEPTMVPAGISAVALGPELGLVTAPGEIFTEIGRHIVDRSPFPQTIYAGYTDGMINYVPTRPAYAEGGYEVTHGCQVAPEGGELLAAASVELLSAVHGR
jgi:neutral/alkaline ceramidase-like enzyme